VLEERARSPSAQEIMLGIAKEEMGHLISVQNVLRLVGAPICLDREDFPWSNEFYPFPFRLERFSKEALAKYLYAESPVDWSGETADEVRAIATQGSGGAAPVQVGKLYNKMIEIFADESFVPDSDFRASTYPFQASWDEWGRGYQGGARGNATRAGVKNTPDVIVQAVASRTDVVNALTAIAQQGEAPKPLAAGDQTSHFRRFLAIYEQLKQVELESETEFDAARPMPVNPYASVDVDGGGDDGWVDPDGTPITDPQAVLWAHLFNVRYRLLLTYLAHTFKVADGLADADAAGSRGMLINATFGEMYNLRAITGVLSSLHLGGSDPRAVAGPPFQMPYSLDLPLDEFDCWRLHRDLLQASARLTAQLGEAARAPDRPYLVALGFHSVGFSPMLRAPSGRDEIEPGHLEAVLEAMVECGQAAERGIVAGRRYPFANLTSALRELHRGTHRPYPCGAGAGYFGVSAGGELAACHRFVGDEDGAMGHVDGGVDPAKQSSWLAERHVLQQSPCRTCWARFLCGGGCHHEAIGRGRPACDYIRGWLHYCLGAYARLTRARPDWFEGPGAESEGAPREA
jgi:radical SAM protein with 4Fe4S-binding SPASM domain